MTLLDEREAQSAKGRLIRILIYPNATNLKNLDQDSYVDVLRWQVEGLNQIRDDLFFYTLLPENAQVPASFEKWMKKQGNVHLDRVYIPSHPPTMRGHFDSKAMSRAIQTRFDVDLVYMHLPEHVFPMKTWMLNGTHFEPRFFGYSHWFDFKDVCKWAQGGLWPEIEGVYELDFCFVNTQAQADKVVEAAAERYNEDALEVLKRSLRPNYLGATEAMLGAQVKKTPATIVFNHRPWEYKDFPNFMRTMDQLRKRRDDFEVFIPLLSKPNRDWVIAPGPPTKREYLARLAKCRIGYAPRQKYEGWSVSALDGLCRGVPFIAYDAGYYRELCPKMEFFTSRSQACDLLEQYLDDNSHRNSRGLVCQRYVKRHRMVEHSIQQLSEGIDVCLTNVRRASTGREGYQKVLKLVKSHGAISKSELIKALGWGVHIRWTPYRNALLDSGEVVETPTAEPIYVYKRTRKRVRLIR